MKCRICARECPPGAKLCRDCAAARKRAFAATVTQPLLAAAGVPSVRQARFAPRPSKARAQPQRKRDAALAARSEAVMVASAADGMARPRDASARRLLLGIAVAIAAVYLLIWIVAVSHGRSSGDAAGPDESASDVAAPAVADAAAVETLRPLPAAEPGTLTPAEANGDTDRDLKKSKPGHHKAVAKVEPPETSATAPPPVAKAEPVPMPRTPPPLHVDAPQDPWQAMNEGLSRCANEDWLHRGSCEQRLRLQYCPNHWGLAWQCPIGPTADHGQ